MVNGDRKYLATVVVHMLADEVHAPGAEAMRCGFPAKESMKKARAEVQIHTFIEWHATCFFYGSVVEAGSPSRLRLIRRVPTDTPVTCA